MRELELKLISELMKDSRQSDRELAKKIGVSQPTITRTRTKLEKKGVIKEYTMLPDLSKLGYEIMALTFVRFREQVSRKDLDEVLKAARNLERKLPHSTLMVMSGIGMNYDRVILSFQENYGSYTEMMQMIRQLPFLDVDHIESFMVNLKDKSHFQPITFSIMAEHILQLENVYIDTHKRA